MVQKPGVMQRSGRSAEATDGEDNQLPELLQFCRANPRVRGCVDPGFGHAGQMLGEEVAHLPATVAGAGLEHHRQIWNRQFRITRHRHHQNGGIGGIE